MTASPATCCLAVLSSTGCSRLVDKRERRQGAYTYHEGHESLVVVHETFNTKYKTGTCL